MDRNAPARRVDFLMRDIQAATAESARRQRWPGATQVRLDAGPAAIAYETYTTSPVGAGSEPAPEFPAAYTTPVSLDLDPGVWLVMAGATFDFTSTIATAVAIIYTGVESNVESWIQSDVGSDATSNDNSPPMSGLSARIVLEEQTTVGLGLAVFTTGANPSATASQSHIVAVPI